MHIDVRLVDLLAIYRAELLERVMPFWLEHTIDRQHGGILTCISDEGQVLSEDKYMWSQLRAIWTFSALYNRVERRAEWLDAARHVFDFVKRYGRDEQGRKRKRNDPTAVYDGQHPAILSEELFQRCQEIRALMRQHPRRHENYTQRLYLLSGIIRCANCKRKMRAQSGNGVRYYQDTSRLQHISDCDQPMVRADEIEEKAARILMNLEIPQDWNERVLAYLRSPQELEQLAQEEQKIQEQLPRLKRLFVEGDLTHEEYQQDKHHLHRRLADLRGNNYSAIIKASKELEGLDEFWYTLSMLERKRLLQAHLTAVLIQGETIVGVQPTLVLYPLFQHQERHRKSGSDGI